MITTEKGWIELSGPDFESPPTLLLPPGSKLWVSPVGNFCSYYTWMDECGRVHSTIIAYTDLTFFGANGITRVDSEARLPEDSG